MSRRDGQRIQRRNSVSGLAFTPKALPGLISWYRADLGVTIATGVSAWADQSGAGNTAVQATGANQPAFNASNAGFNGRPTITGTLNQSLSATVATPNPLTLFVVGTLSASSFMVAGNGAWSLTDNGVNLVMNSGTGNALGPRAVSVAASMVAIDGVNGQVRTSQHTGGSVVDTGASTGTLITILNSVLVSNGGNVMAEMAIWNRVLTAGEIDRLNTYASSRYAIGIGA